jgi:AraC-like DNA-binding protein
MNDTLLSWYQALQLLALGPCLFMLFFLCVAVRDPKKVLVPVLYFLCLSCSFILPLGDLFSFSDAVQAMLLLGISAAPALSFLLIVQFMTGRMPKAPYWAILAVPLIGGGQIAHATVMTQGEVCIYEHLCTQPFMFRKLYDIFSASLTCLLTLLMYRRLNVPEAKEHPWQVLQKYALVLALLTLNLALLGIDLAQMTDVADLEHARLAKTVVRIGFIYLVLTSMFRVFDRPLDLAYERVPSMRPKAPSDQDRTLSARVSEFFAQEKPHRDMDLSREKLARRLGVTESVLSRVVNQCFGENVSMLVNRYRVEEAKVRLAGETTAITVIAFEVGFSSIPSFNRVFKALAGLSPTEYRQQSKRKA